ncbi:MAG: acetylglutamate kinase [Pleurocapsa sp. SU_196_0]|nr:acetylglutamate kinase [Pleurocapsa sp. SU_196_0]
MVVKYGGNAMKSLELRRAVSGEIAALRSAHRVVVVHGGGPVIERNLKRLNIESSFLRGLRVTTPEALEVIESALTLLGKELSQDIGHAVGLTGRDDHLLQAVPLEAEFGRVGRVERVNTALLETLLSVGLTPVIGCIAVDESGDALNVNADWAAGAVAGAMTAPVIFLTDVNGVRRDPTDPSSLASSLSATEVRAWIDNGSISGGMIPKVEAALYALERGAPSATIASGMEAGVLEKASSGAAGTRIVA